MTFDAKFVSAAALGWRRGASVIHRARVALRVWRGERRTRVDFNYSILRMVAYMLHCPVAGTGSLF